MKLLACVLLALVPSMMLGELVQCPGKTVMQNFDFSRFQGQWNVVRRNEELRDITCVQHILETENDTTSIIAFKYTDLTQRLRVTTEGTIWKTDSSGKLLSEVTTDVAEPYWILDTDYDKYAVTYSCTHSLDLVQDEWKVLSRTADLPQEVTAAVNSVLQANNMAGRMFTVLHNNC